MLRVGFSYRTLALEPLLPFSPRSSLAIVPIQLAHYAWCRSPFPWSGRVISLVWRRRGPSPRKRRQGGGCKVKVRCLAPGTMRWSCSRPSMTVGSAYPFILCAQAPSLLWAGGLEASSQWCPSYNMFCHVVWGVHGCKPLWVSISKLEPSKE